MNVILTTLNAKFTHSNLALRYLKRYCQDEFPDVKVKEFNINQDLALITAELVKENPDVLGFSCYIWNIEQTLDMIADIHKILPEVVIVLGGPEVSYEYTDLMENYPEIDFIISGEGEYSFYCLLQNLYKKDLTNSSLEKVPGLIYRENNIIKSNSQVYGNLQDLPLIYDTDFASLKNKIVYYETSRGCPFKCEYCLSSRTGKVRYFPIERCKKELRKLATLGLEQIRFVDRTFNCNNKRALELLKFMTGLKTNTRFQLEISGDMITDEMIDILKSAPPNRFQFEIGVQSTNPITLANISRKTDLSILTRAVTRLRKETNVTFLLDLIAGLPYETLERFGKSFDFVYNLYPSKIQLGFLKLLKGSELRGRVSEFGCFYTKKAPYEVLQTDSIDYLQLHKLKVIEDLVEQLVNSQRFSYSLHYLITNGKVTPFELFNLLANHWLENKYHLVSHSIFSIYGMLFDFFGKDYLLLKEFLRLDFRLNEAKRATPEWLSSNIGQKTTTDLVQSTSLLDYFPQLQSMSPREIGKKIKVEKFDWEIYPWKSDKVTKKSQTLLFYYPNQASNAEVFQVNE